MELSERVVGVVLSGGRSSRMGGGDKCLLSLGGQSILARIVERLRPQVSRLIINANGDPSRFANFDLPVISDSLVGFAGPLAGVHAGLQWVKACACDCRFIVSVASDTPFFPGNLVQRFLADVDDYHAFLIAASSEGTHPVIGLWPVSMASQIEESLRRGARKVGAFAADHGAAEVFFPTVSVGKKLVDPFFNINRPEDLNRAETLLREAS